ncbi:MAG: hypothetical protein KDK76_00730 [Chlamydiia bacterium]|nr:hypothetical protein [Chlamydiia bacterium]
MKVFVSKFYPEEFRRKGDQEKYSSKGTCEIHLLLGPVEMDLKNITYRIDHEGRISLKPPFRVHSNKKRGIKPKLVPSIVFKECKVWEEIEKAVKGELFKEVHELPKKRSLQLDLFQEKN